MKQTRNRTDRRRPYRHERAEIDLRPSAVRVSRRGAADEVVLHVHVHNDVVLSEEPRSRSGRERNADTGAKRVIPSFRGCLFGWEDHYFPIAKRLAPMIMDGQKPRGWKASLGRFGRWGFLVVWLIAILAIGCNWL